jgi:hypothetical protein
MSQNKFLPALNALIDGELGFSQVRQKDYTEEISQASLLQIKCLLYVLHSCYQTLAICISDHTVRSNHDPEHDPIN